MSDIILPHTITPNTLADADEVQENFEALADDAANKTGDTFTGTMNTQHLIPTADSTYDLGTDALRYRNLYVDAITGPGATNSFSTIAISGQSDVVADSSADTLTLAAGTGITLTTNATTDTVTISNASSSQAGSSAINFKAGGTIYQDQTTAGNVGTGEDTIYTKSWAANLLANDGESITFRMCGDFANNTNEKRIRVKYGSTTILDMTDDQAPRNCGWVLTGTVTRLSSTTQRVEATMLSGNAVGSLIVFVGVTTASETLSGAVTFTITGEATSTNDIRYFAGKTWWYPATSN